MASSFATSSQLAARLGRTFTSAQAAQAELLLAGASARVRVIADQHISEVEDDVITLEAPYSTTLWLPQRPVIAVSEVKVDDVVTTDWQLRGSRLVRSCVWASPCDEHEITVTYTHGYKMQDVDDLALAVDATLAFAAEAMSNPSGVKSRRIDDYAVTYGDSSGSSSEFLEAAIRKKYGRRPRTRSVPA